MEQLHREADDEDDNEDEEDEDEDDEFSVSIYALVVLVGHHKLRISVRLRAHNTSRSQHARLAHRSRPQRATHASGPLTRATRARETSNTRTTNAHCACTS